jgi:hypothetical protein
MIFQDLKFKANVIAFIGPACGFALEPGILFNTFSGLSITYGIESESSRGSEAKECFVLCNPP